MMLIWINPFRANVPIDFNFFLYTAAFLYPLKTSENLWFLTFSGGIEMLQYTGKH